MTSIQATIGSLGDPYKDGTPNLEIKIDAKLAAGQRFVASVQTTVVLRIQGTDYIGSVLAHKPEHKVVWISPTIQTLKGERLRLGEILSDAGYAANDQIQLSIQTPVVIEVGHMA